MAAISHIREATFPRIPACTRCRSIIRWGRMHIRGCFSHPSGIVSALQPTASRYLLPSWGSSHLPSVKVLSETKLVLWGYRHVVLSLLLTPSLLIYFAYQAKVIQGQSRKFPLGGDTVLIVCLGLMIHLGLHCNTYRCIRLNQDEISSHVWVQCGRWYQWGGPVPKWNVFSCSSFTAFLY